jgi:hypothetical protein
MIGVLQAILCFLKDMLYILFDIGLGHWDSILGAADSFLSQIGGTPWTFSTIPTQYAWLLGSTGIAESLTIIATALGIRFLLQSVPFVRWGS